tara:strand:- start:271 stop:1149 length:879 start_codon:yes stop_codon:yes gene_type:complete
MFPAHPPAIAVRIATIALVLTFIDDGLRELKDVGAQCGYLEGRSNNIVMPHWAALLYVLASLTIQLGAGFYVIVYAILTPGGRLLLPHNNDSGLLRHVRTALWLLAAFVLSSVIIYGLGQPASQHAQGRLVFILRNLGILGGVLLLLGVGTASSRLHALLLLLARAMLAGHGLELAPVNSLALLSVVDVVVIPLALALLFGLHTRAVALVLAVLLACFDMSINHFWSGFRYNDNIRYYFYEDLSIIGGLLLLATAGGGELSLDTCRSKELPLGVIGRRGGAPETQSLLADTD